MLRRPTTLKNITFECVKCCVVCRETVSMFFQVGWGSHTSTDSAVVYNKMACLQYVGCDFH